jgi:hypothetical protein
VPFTAAFSGTEGTMIYKFKSKVSGDVIMLAPHGDQVRAVLERQSDEHRVELVANVGHHATLVVDATFTLTPIDGGETIVAGTAFASASYDRTQQRYAAIRAARDAEIRIARTLAEQIKTRIAAHFATQG